MMMIVAKRMAVTAALLIGGLLVAIWLLLFSSLLAEPRGNIAASILSQRVGQEFEILGGVKLSLESGLRVSAQDVVVPAEKQSGTSPLKILSIETTLELRSLLRGQLSLNDVHIDGAEVAFVVNSDGATSWPDLKQASASKKYSDDANIESRVMISDRQIQLTNAGVTYKNARNGLDLDLKMVSLVLDQATASAPWKMQTEGKLNGQPLKIDGALSSDESFNLEMTSDQIDLKIEGAQASGGYASGFEAIISANFNKLAPLLDILKLQKSVAGRASARAALTVDGTSQKISDLKLDVALTGGQSLSLTGDFGEIRDLNDATLKMDISLYAKDEMPQPAMLLSDLKLTGFGLVVTAQPTGFPVRQLQVQTNGFVLNSKSVGPTPIYVSDIKITPQGALDFGKMQIGIGPPDSYFLALKGAVSDVLNVDGIDFEGTIDLPTTAVIDPKQFDDAKVPGKVIGGFHLSGNADKLAISDFQAKIEGTDLAQLNVSAALDNVLSLSGFSLDVSADIPSGAKLLSALKLPVVPTGEIKLSTKLSSEEQKLLAQTQISVAKSDMEMTLSTDTSQTRSELNGQIVSTLLRIQDIRHVLALFSELGLPGRNKNKSGTGLSDVTLEPVLTQILQSGLDMGVTIDLKKLQGVAGTSAIKTKFVLKNNFAQMGPVKFDYDGGHFDATGSVDLNKNPDKITFKGTANGWNFGTILQDMGIKKHGSGIVNARFDLSGSHKTAVEFTNSASGNILVSMRNGDIQTRLINIAGLGVFPWLFSDDHGKVAPIVCLRAPLRFDNGKITVKEAAMETSKVQLVANGDVNLREKTINVTGEPRPIGKPLSRSPWPFVVSGPLEHPKMRLKWSATRHHRADGADKMPIQRKLCVPDILQLQ